VGVALEDAHDYLAAGAVAVGVSSQLFMPEAIESGDWANDYGAIAVSSSTTPLIA
jgi:2-keto-3-deoxy-6-phosphogluconate aldolase